MDRLQQIIEKCNEQERVELTVLHNATISNLKAYKDDSNSTNLKNWEASKDKLDRVSELLWAKYFNAQPTFDNIAAVVTHLQEQGYDVKKSKVYGDAKKGLLRVEEGGRITELAVRAYSAGLDKKSRLRVEDVEDRTVRKLEQEIKRLETQNKSAQFDLDIKQGKYILRSEFEMEMAARCAVFESGLRYFFQAKAGELIDVVAGDRGRSGDMIDMLNRCLDSVMNDFADCEKYQVMIMCSDQAVDQESFSVEEH